MDVERNGGVCSEGPGDIGGYNGTKLVLDLGSLQFSKCSGNSKLPRLGQENFKSAISTPMVNSVVVKFVTTPAKN